jgi:hypothetical protein
VDREAWYARVTYAEFLLQDRASIRDESMLRARGIYDQIEILGAQAGHLERLACGCCSHLAGVDWRFGPSAFTYA